MTRVSETAGRWFGLCRKPPAVRVLVHTGILPESVYESSPDGRAGGPGTIRRGIGTALSGMRTLNRNRQLLWFTLFAGILLAGTTIIQGALGYVSWHSQPYIGETEWVVLNGIIEFATLFCLVYLLAGLVLIISTENGRPASFFESLGRAKKYLTAIMLWSCILALAGMVLFSIYFYIPDWLPRNHLFVTTLGALSGWVNLLREFPFNPALTPYTMLDPSRDGGIPLIFWVYPSGIQQAVTFSAINLFLFILTPFVMPFVALEQKPLGQAVAGSFALMKKNWGEAVSCALFLGVIVAGVFLSYLLLQAASGMITPDAVGTMPPDTPWTALALLYDGALFCFAMVMATVGGIAAQDLYRSAKRRQIAAESPEPAGVVH
jgi:hypothetical protein